MSIITKIEGCKKHKNRVNIFVDEKFFCAVFDEVCHKEKLKVGQEIDEEKISQILSREEQQKCDQTAVKYLSRFYKSKSEVKAYLLKKGFLEDCANKTIAKCEEYGYLNDQNFAKNFTLSKMHTCSKKQIEFELKNKGIDKWQSAEFLDKVDEEQTINYLALKYFKSREKSYENITKFKASLFRKGFSYEKINGVCAKIFEGSDQDDWD